MMACACSVVIARESEAIGLLDLDEKHPPLIVGALVDANLLIIFDGEPSPEPFLASILMLVVAIDGDQISVVIVQPSIGLVSDVGDLDDDRRRNILQRDLGGGHLGFGHGGGYQLLF